MAGNNKAPELTSSELLRIPGLFEEALDRTSAPACGGGYVEWLHEMTGIMCWLRLLGRSGEAVMTCDQWSRFVDLSAEDIANNTAIIRSNARQVETFSFDDVVRFASGFMFRCPGLISDAYKGQAGRPYSPTAKEKRESAEQRERQRQEFERRQAEIEQATAKDRQKASEKSTAMLAKANKDPRLSPYWQAKEKAAGLPLPMPSDICCDDVRMFLPVIGPVYWNNSLLVPLYIVGGDLNLCQVSVEIICGTSNPQASRTGEKRGLKHGRREGVFYPINISAARNDSPIVICEGVSSGVALNMMTGGKLPIFCAMSCGNFESVLDELRALYEHSPVFIVGDVGEGHRFAKRLADGLPCSNLYAVDLEPCLPEQDGADPFDILARHGVENGRVLLRSMFRTARGLRGDDSLCDVSGNS